MPGVAVAVGDEVAVGIAGTVGVTVGVARAVGVPVGVAVAVGVVLGTGRLAACAVSLPPSPTMIQTTTLPISPRQCADQPLCFVHFSLALFFMRLPSC